MAKRFYFAPCCRAAIGTIWWMKANLSPLPAVYDPGKGRSSAASPGIIGPDRDGWGCNVRAWGDPSKAVIRESVHLDECPHCKTDLRPLQPSGSGYTSRDLDRLILSDLVTLTGR